MGSKEEILKCASIYFVSFFPEITLQASSTYHGKSLLDPGASRHVSSAIISSLSLGRVQTQAT